MKKEEDMIKRVIEACEKLVKEGTFPSISNIAKEIRINENTFRLWIKDNDDFKNMIKNAKIDWINTVDFEKLVKSIGVKNGAIFQSLKPEEQLLVKKRIIETGIERLKRKKEFPSNSNIAKEIGMNSSVFRNWVNDNPVLKDMIKNAKIEWINTVDFEKLVESAKHKNGFIFKSLEPEEQLLAKKRIERLKENDESKEKYLEFTTNKTIREKLGVKDNEVNKIHLKKIKDNCQ